MKSILLILFTACSCLAGPTAAPPSSVPDRVVRALHGAESGFRQVSRRGSRGEVGPLQITQAVVDDVNRVYGMSFELADCERLDKAQAVCRMYLAMWGAHLRGLGHHVDDEKLARLWNGGPSNWRSEQAGRYWHTRVRRHLGK